MQINAAIEVLSISSSDIESIFFQTAQTDHLLHLTKQAILEWHFSSS